MVEQTWDWADDRLVNGCLYCGGAEESRDHVPSRVFLDEPFPEQLPIVWACIKCNNGYSDDEAYVACLIEVAIAGSSDPEKMRREKIANLLRKFPKLQSKLEKAKRFQDGAVHFEVESERIKNIGLKLARGHAAFELSQVLRDEPTFCWWQPLHALSDAERDDFDCIDVLETLGEVGSRGMQRMYITQVAVDSINGEGREIHNIVFNDWVEVQDARYRYIAIDRGYEIRVKIILAEYLAFEVCWDRSN